MKRSEMVKILDEAIQKSIIEHDEMVPAYDAEEILKALEIAGMLPAISGEVRETIEIRIDSNLENVFVWEKE